MAKKIWKMLGFIPVHEHLREMREHERTLEEEYKKKLVDYKKQMLSMPVAGREALEKSQKETVGEMESYYKERLAKLETLEKNEIILKKTIETYKQKIAELEKSAKLTDKGAEKRIKELEAQLKTVNEELRKHKPYPGVVTYKKGDKTLLEQEDIDVLKERGYEFTQTYDLDGKKTQCYVLAEVGEKLTHATLRHMLYEKAKELNPGVITTEVNDKADVEITSKSNKKIGFEVQSGHELKEQEKVKEKLSQIKGKYDQLYIVVYSKSDMRAYESLGLDIPVITIADVAKTLEGIR